MKRIFLSLSVIGVVSALSLGATGAFFSDTEISSGNTFTAGAIDLKIDNTSYYNGVASPNTSWELRDLTIEKFFNFLDLKPGDVGEDTISLHVDTNDAYMCANVSLTSNDDNGINEPESAVDQTDGPGQGELAAAVNFLWWADDGDNVLESNENVISQGPIGALGLGGTTTVALADSVGNIWTGVPGPVPGEQTLYIGKAWCFGTLGQEPLPQDGFGADSDRTPANSTGGITCDGSALDNSTQTDSLTADVEFTAVQARNNPNFRCVPGEPCTFDPEVNLVTNGGFENPIVVHAANWNVFPSVAGNWTVEWRSDIPATFGPQNRPATANLELHKGVLGPAFEGLQYAELDSDWGGPNSNGTGEPASIKISQMLTTVPGAEYTVSYRFAPRPNTSAANNNLEVRMGGIVVDTTGPTAGPGGNPVFALRSVNFTATTTQTRIEFTDLGTADSLGTFLDDVEVNQISCVNQ